MKTLILNLYGGPGTGKSTTCAGIFAELKLRDVNCEMALEYAKDRVWEESVQTLHNQIYVFGKQFHRIWRLLGKVDIIITDSPLLNSLLYSKGENPHFSRLVFEEHRKLSNLNVLLERKKRYNPAGRLQDENKAKSLDLEIAKILDFLGEPYFCFPAVRPSMGEIADLALIKLKHLNG